MTAQQARLTFPGWWLIVWCLLTAMGIQPVRAAGGVELDHWYLLLLENQPAGWSHVRVTRDKDVITTANQTQLSIRRGPITMTIKTASRFEETLSGKPLAAQSIQQLGAAAVEQTMRFTPTGIELTTQQNQQKQVQTLPLPQQGWLPPAALRRHVEQQAAQGAQQIQVRTMDPSMGPRVFEVQLKLIGEQNVQAVGKVVPAIVWEMRTSMLPGMVAREYLDPQGHPIRSQVTLMPGLELTMVLADEQIARGQINPPELLLSTLVKPDRPVVQPRTLRKATYTLRVADQPAGDQDHQAVIVETDAQTVRWTDPSTAVVTVDLDAEPGLRTEPADLAACLQATVMANRDDPAIIKLLRQAIPLDSPATPGATAERLRQFVYRHIQAKDLSVGFATASEVARTRQGDCTEHAVLLAALLRAADIPSRTVSGLVYADQFMGQKGVFGYHMWTQAWLADDQNPALGRWVDLDAALDPQQPFDATHIALAISRLADDEMGNDMVELASLMGRLSIEVK